MSALILNQVTQVANHNIQIQSVAPSPLADFTAALATTTDSGWQELLGGPPSAATINSQFNAYYSAWLSYSGAPSNSSLWSTAQKTAWFQALYQSATLDDNPANSSAPSYLQTFFLFFPNASLAQAKAQFQQFYNAQVSQYGFFVPGIFFQKWGQTLSSQLASGISIVMGLPVDATNLASGNYSKTLVLNRIYSLISTMLATLQRVAAMQANRLFILTSWQKAYTDALSQMHTFLLGDHTGLGVPGDPAAQQRAIANDTINARFQQIMQNNRGVIGDDAQTVQSSVNQSNDTVSQQANMATAIIQELTTLLSAIYR